MRRFGGGEMQRGRAGEHRVVQGRVLLSEVDVGVRNLSQRLLGCSGTGPGVRQRDGEFAVGVLLVWLVLYVRVSAPINRQLTTAAKTAEVPPNARVLQSNWDRIITARAVLQGLATAAVCLAPMF